MDVWQLEELLKEHDKKETFIGVDEILKIASSVASALEHTEDLDRLHRDTKPANILCVDGTWMLTDFDIGWVIRPMDHAGTPKAEEPERQKQREDSPFRPDIRPLGFTLYQLISNREPFTRPGLLPVRPSCFRRFSDSVADRVILAELDRICLRCYHPDRRYNYDTAREVAHDLRSLIAKEPIKRAVEPWYHRFPRVWMARPILLTAVFMLVLVGIGIGIQTLVESQKIAQARAQRDLEHREEIAKRAVVLLAMIGELRVRIKEESKIAAKSLEESRNMLARDRVRPSDVAVRMRLQTMGALQVKEAITRCDRGLEICGELPQGTMRSGFEGELRVLHRTAEGMSSEYREQGEDLVSRVRNPPNNLARSCFSS